MAFTNNPGNLPNMTFILYQQPTFIIQPVYTPPQRETILPRIAPATPILQNNKPIKPKKQPAPKPETETTLHSEIVIKDEPLEEDFNESDMYSGASICESGLKELGKVSEEDKKFMLCKNIDLKVEKNEIDTKPAIEEITIKEEKIDSDSDHSLHILHEEVHIKEEALPPSVPPTQPSSSAKQKKKKIFKYAPIQAAVTPDTHLQHGSNTEEKVFSEADSYWIDVFEDGATPLEMTDEELTTETDKTDDAVRSHQSEVLETKNIINTPSSTANATEITIDSDDSLSMLHDEIDIKDEPLESSSQIPVQQLNQNNTKTEKPKVIYKCEYCKEEFHQKRKHMVHLKKVHGELPLKCDICEKGFRKYPSLLKHREANHIPKNKFKCNSCKKVLNKSKQRKHKCVPIIFKCSTCGKEYSTNKSLQTHSLLHTSPKKCNICMKEFSMPNQLKKHQLTHNQSERFKCKLCKRVFLSEYKFKHHEISHIERPFQCQRCTRRFTSSALLENHVLEHPVFKCTECDKVFIKRSSLLKHVTLHSENKPFECPVCSKKFKTKENMRKHTIVHVGTKRFGCSICGIRFRQKTAFDKHLNFHKQGSTDNAL